MLIEICTNSFRSAKIAAAHGADRIELCQSLESGGLTPSAGDIKHSVALKSGYDFKVNVLIRPRNGDFCYDADEYAVMLEDIRYCRAAGVDGVVVGALTKEGNIDYTGMEKLIAAAGEMSLTFHRAFDLCQDPDAALKPLSALGFHRVLTSGCAPTAELGKENIKRWIELSEGKPIIMPGSGINNENIRDLIRFTGAKEVHLSAKGKVKSAFELDQDLFDFNYLETQGELVRRVKELVNSE